MTSLIGKKILVTGSTNGIGRQTALQPAGMGARVLLHDHNKQRLEKTGNKNSGMYQADLVHFDEVKAMVELGFFYWKQIS